MSKIITNTEVEQFKKDGAREERTIMEANGYKNGDNIAGKMFPKLWSLG